MKKTSKPGTAGIGERRSGERLLEMLEALLSFAVPARKTGPLARSLKERFGGIRGVLDASGEELVKVEGMNDKAASIIMLMKPLARTYLKERIADRDIIKDPRDVINYLRLTLYGEKVEKFMGLYLNSRNELLAVEVLHEGTLTHALVYPRKVIELAMKHNASSVIFVHNHPGGDPSPSMADCLLMRSLEKAAATVDITVHDHMIIGRNRHFSARANGWPFENSPAFPRAAESGEPD